MATVSKLIAENAASIYAQGKKGFQPAIVYIVEQAFQGNANEATRILKLARMINPKGDLLADGRSVVDYMEQELDFALVSFDNQSGSFKMVKDWQASADTIDLSGLWTKLQDTPWYDWKKASAPQAQPSIIKQVAKLEKTVKQAKGITLEEQKTALDSLAVLMTAIRAMPIVEPEEESESESDKPAITAEPTNPEYDAEESIAEMKKEEEYEKAVAETFKNALEIARTEGTKWILDINWAQFNTKQRYQLFLAAGETESAAKFAKANKLT